jgi:hypothetical protein
MTACPTETPPDDGAAAAQDAPAPDSEYDSGVETQEHIADVRRRIERVCRELTLRGEIHDASKLGPVEKPARDQLTPRLRAAAYGSDEYKTVLAEMGEAVTHHVANNPHHPEHYENGVAGMSLIDLLEMYCDWAAAVRRYPDWDLARSIENNTRRYGLDPQLASIMRNTVARFGDFGCRGAA